MKKTTKKSGKKPVRKPAAFKTPKLSTTMSLETMLARMIDLTDKGDRVVVMVEFLKGTPRPFQSAVLKCMTRESSVLILEAAGVGYKAPEQTAPEPVQAPEPEPVQAPVDPNVQITDSSTVFVGPYSSKWAADQDVMQFMHPKVMSYRPTVFPSPSTYGVEVNVAEAHVVNVSDIPSMAKPTALNNIYPYAIELTVSIEGKAEKVRNWIAAFNRLNHFTKVR